MNLQLLYDMNILSDLGQPAGRHNQNCNRVYYKFFIQHVHQHVNMFLLQGSTFSSHNFKPPMHQPFLIQIRILNPEQDQLNLYTGIEKMYSDMIFFVHVLQYTKIPVLLHSPNFILILAKSHRYCHYTFNITHFGYF